MPLALHREAQAQMLYLAFEIKQMFLRSLMELSYASFPEEEKNAVLNQPFFLAFFLFFSQALSVFSERENRRLSLALTFTATR